MMKIFIASRSFGKISSDALDLLQNKGEIIRNPLGRALNSSELRENLLDIDAALLGNDVCDANVLNSSGRLKVVSRNGVGVDAVDLKAATENGIIVTNTPGVNTIAVAEHTIALMFALLRKIPEATSSLKSKKWEGLKFVGEELTGKKLGIIGLGSIGLEVAKKVKGLGIEVLYLKRKRNYELEKQLGLTYRPLNDLLQEADIVSLHLPFTSETKSLMGKREIALMKKGAYIINTARGKIIDNDALIDGLRSGQLSGIALDVFDTEPPDYANPLFEMENVIVTPHIGAYTREAVVKMNLIAAENIVNVLNNRMSEYVVNKDVLSRKNLRVNLADLHE